MILLLLLCVSAAFACIPMTPTSPGIPAGPGTGGPSVPGPAAEKPCTPLTRPWDLTECGVRWGAFGVVVPCYAGTSDTMDYMCPMGQPTAYGTITGAKFDSISCDTTKGEWIYTRGSQMQTLSQIEPEIGTGLQYAC
ncbi:hypothetical protein PENTCL1PPCAC_3473, partial [Pristionchus entomophagus]